MDLHLVADLQVVEPPARIGLGELHAAGRRGGEVALVEGDAALGEEHRPRHLGQPFPAGPLLGLPLHGVFCQKRQPAVERLQNGLIADILRGMCHERSTQREHDNPSIHHEVPLAATRRAKARGSFCFAGNRTAWRMIHLRAAAICGGVLFLRTSFNQREPTS